MRVGFGTGPALELEALALELAALAAPALELEALALGFAWLCISGTCLGFGICLDFPAKSELGRLGALVSGGGIMAGIPGGRLLVSPW